MNLKYYWEGADMPDVLPKTNCLAINVPGDGNCFYYSLCVFEGVDVHDYGTRCRALRLELNNYLFSHLDDITDGGLTVRDWIGVNLDEIKSFRRYHLSQESELLYGPPHSHTCDSKLDEEKDPVLQYMEFMADDTPGRCEWGTSLELYAYAKLKQVNGVVYKGFPNDQSPSYLLSPLNSRILSNSLPTICLVEGGNHYQALVPINQICKNITDQWCDLCNSKASSSGTTDVKSSINAPNTSNRLSKPSASVKKCAELVEKMNLSAKKDPVPNIRSYFDVEATCVDNDSDDVDEDESYNYSSEKDSFICDSDVEEPYVEPYMAEEDFVRNRQYSNNAANDDEEILVETCSEESDQSREDPEQSCESDSGESILTSEYSYDSSVGFSFGVTAESRKRGQESLRQRKQKSRKMQEDFVRNRQYSNNAVNDDEILVDTSSDNEQSYEDIEQSWESDSSKSFLTSEYSYDSSVEFYLGETAESRKRERENLRQRVQKSRKKQSSQFLNLDPNEEVIECDELDRCSNCRRKQMFSKVDGYMLNFTEVRSDQIRNIKTQLKMIDHHKASRPLRRYNLCEECKTFLYNDPTLARMTPKQIERLHLLGWNNTWPAFLYNLLSGQQRSDKKHFYDVYQPTFLWQWIPDSLRPYWIDAIHEIDGDIYSECTVNDPPSLFRDRTVDIEEFRADIDSYELPRFLHALLRTDRREIMIPDVLCPWGCTEFCFRAQPFNFNLLIQHHLRKVVLNMPSLNDFKLLKYVESSRQDYIRPPHDRDHVLLNRKWPYECSVAFIPGQGLMLLNCRFHSKFSETEKIYLHLPRKPHHTLSAIESDQLSHCSVQSRILRPMKIGVYNTTWSLQNQLASFSGVDTMNVANEGKFAKQSCVLIDHMALSLCRSDINHLLSRYVLEGVVTKKLAEDLRKRSSLYYQPSSLTPFIQGATYIGVQDSMIYQKDVSEDSLINVVVIQKNKRTNLDEEVEISVRRTWPRTINVIEMEDIFGYGYPLKPIDMYSGSRTVGPAMMMWTMTACITGCKELWQAIDNKVGVHRFNEWEGHILTHYHSKYFQHETLVASQLTPFKSMKNKTDKEVFGRLQSFMPDEMQSFSGFYDDNPEFYFMFNVEYWRNLFPRYEYETISIQDSIENARQNIDESAGSTVIIVVETSCELSKLDCDYLESDGSAYELRSIVYLQPILKQGRGKRPPSINVKSHLHFKATRYVRRGGGFNSWWKQDRYQGAPHFMTHVWNENPLDAIPVCCFGRVSVFVKIDEEEHIERHRLDLFKFIGGQVHVMCRCNSFPLILSGRDKRVCMNDGCKRKEKFMCCKMTCTTRVCTKCFDNLRKSEGPIYCDPPLEIIPEVQNMQAPSSDFADYHIASFESESGNESSEDEILVGEANEVSFRSRILQQELIDRKDDRLSSINTGLDDNEFFLQDYPTVNNYNPVDDIDLGEGREEGEIVNDDDDNVDNMEEFIPLTSDAGSTNYTVLTRTRRQVVPFHVLLNQAGTVCKRYNKRINGTQEQQQFVQRLVSTVVGTSMPLLYPEGMTHPRHFYAQASHDSHAILGAVPLSCYTSTPTYPHGIADSLSNARLHRTLGCSSISTCQSSLSFDYDLQCNKTAGSLDSRLINKNGFIVDIMNKHGISMRDSGRTELNHGVDSHQTALNLAATQLYHAVDWFLTFTCNHAKHPGIKHLYWHKVGKTWTEFIPRYNDMSDLDREEVMKCFEQGFGLMIGRCWMEVSELLIEFISKSPIILGAPSKNVFWRYEYQEEAANLYHIHGLIELDKEFMKTERSRILIYDLQKCDIANLVPTKDIQEYIAEGLFDCETDWFTVTDLGEEILRHKKHTDRCMVLVSEEDNSNSLQSILDSGEKKTSEKKTSEKKKSLSWSKDFKCRVNSAAEQSIHPLEHEFKPFHFEFPYSCLVILADCGLYEWPSSGYPKGKFFDAMLTPTRHIGRITPGCPDRMSPVISKLFAMTRSMQNAQVLTGTGGVARYIVKYVCELDQANRTVVWADPHKGAMMRVDEQFLHNTKITRSRQNEKKIFEKSRQFKKPVGRSISPMEMLQQLMGVSEVRTTFRHVNVATTSFEFRPTTPIELDSRGNLQRPDREEPSDSQSSLSISTVVRNQMHRRHERFNRFLSPNQNILYEQNGKHKTKFDKLTEFGLRPVELVELVPNLPSYFRWFHIDDKVLDGVGVAHLLKINIVKCAWIDGFGRQVFLRYAAFKEANEFWSLFDTENLSTHSRQLLQHLLKMIRFDKRDDLFVYDERLQLPVPVFSSVSPFDSISFINHILLVLGEYVTELDFRTEHTLRDSFAKAKLIGPKQDRASLQKYSNDLMRRVILETLKPQPASMRLLCDFFVATKQILDKVIIFDEIPINEIPPCLLTEMLDKKEEELQTFANTVRANILDAIYSSVNDDDGQFPVKIDVLLCTKNNPLEWDLLLSFTKYAEQSEESYDEQRYVISIGKAAVDKYLQVLGPKATIFTKSIIIHGVPGAGKTFLGLLIGLYAMTKGLRVITTAMMAARAVTTGGIHAHAIFGWSTNPNVTPYRLAELALEKLNRKSNMKYLYLIMTTDVLIFDEIFQTSAAQFSALDILFRRVRKSKIAFGGVLVIGAMDSQQFAPINGLPFLISSLVTTMFTIVELKHSVRAHSDPVFQEIQNISRMSPRRLQGDKSLEREFKTKVGQNLTFVSNWNDKRITPNMLRLYARKKPVQDALKDYVQKYRTEFDRNKTPYVISQAEDFQQKRRTIFEPATSRLLLDSLDKNMKEPRTLLLFRGGLYFATINGKGFYQSQLLVLPELPSSNVIAAKGPITMYVASAGSTMFFTSEDEPPTVEELIQNNWKKVRVGMGHQQHITIQGIEGYRKQYSLVHIIATTINKQTGNTLPECAVEFTKGSAPWIKTQVVVLLSRTTVGPKTIIVGPKTAAINQMWNIITTGNQWTDFIERLLASLSIHVTDEYNQDNDRSNEDHHSEVFDYAKAYPYKMNNIDMPSDDSGYVYLIVSVPDPTKGYVGQAENLSERVREHNSGRGSQGTSDPTFLPYFPAAYICGLSELDETVRRRLEREWQRYNMEQIRSGNRDIWTRIEQGQRVVNDYNSTRPLEFHIRFIIMMRHK